MSRDRREGFLCLRGSHGTVPRYLAHCLQPVTVVSFTNLHTSQLSPAYPFRNVETFLDPLRLRTIVPSDRLQVREQALIFVTVTLDDC